MIIFPEQVCYILGCDYLQLELRDLSYKESQNSPPPQNIKKATSSVIYLNKLSFFSIS